MIVIIKYLKYKKELYMGTVWLFLIYLTFFHP